MNRRRVLAGASSAALLSGAAYVSLRQMGSMETYNASIAQARAELTLSPDLSELVRYAVLAANGHNTQPWRFEIGENKIDILPDFSRRTPIVDPDDHHLFASLGCAAENLLIAAGARGRRGRLSFNHADGGSLRIEFATAAASPSDLFDAIPRRQSTRADFDGRPVDIIELNKLAAMAAVDDVDVVMITDRPRIDRVRDLVIAGNSAQIADPAFVRELKMWMRFNPRQALQSGDGLFSAASASPIAPTWLGTWMFDWFFRADAENEKYARQLDTSAGVAVFSARKDDPQHWVQAGRACQRFSLQATALGLKHSFINQPAEVRSLWPELASLVGLPGRRPDIVIRFGYGATLPYAPRRPVQAVLRRHSDDLYR